MTGLTVELKEVINKAHKLLNMLCDKSLEPRPHYRVLPARLELTEEKIWMIKEKNEVGYIITDYNFRNEEYETKIEGFIRVSNNQFEKLELLIKRGLKSPLKIKWRLGNAILGEKEFNKIRGDISIKYPVIDSRGRVKSTLALELKIVKCVKRTYSNGVPINKILFRIENATLCQRLRIGNKTYEFGHILEFKIVEKAVTGRILIRKLNDIKGYGVLPQIDPILENFVNGIGKEYDQLTFYDYYIGVTRTPLVKTINKRVKELQKELQIEPEIVYAIERLIEDKGSRLYTFQYEAFKKISSEIAGQRKPIVLTAKTAAGKTEAFMFPIINWILKIKKQGRVKGIKAIIIYPTKALANDQLQRILEILFYVNKVSKHKVTVGIYHGDIEERIIYQINLPVRCVNPECPSIKEGIRGGQRLKIRRENTHFPYLYCSECSTNYDYVLIDRSSILSSLPDVLIATPDILNYSLALAEEEERLRLFGKDANIHPQVIVIDEVHLFSGFLGGNVAAFLQRMEKAMKHIALKQGIIYKKPLYIASSATIRNPLEFLSDFFNTRQEHIILIKPKKEDLDFNRSIYKLSVFVSPKTWRLIDAASYMIYTLMKIDPNSKILCFVNTLYACDEILSNLVRRLEADSITQNLIDKIGGHSSRYSRQERARIEEEFNKGVKNVLIATSTLEVGVDIPRIDTLILYSMPFSFNSYIQRIGRAGRSAEERTIIINILNPLDPIDMYYFRYAPMIVNNPSAFLEYIPFPRYNYMILEKHAIASIFDYMHLNGIEYGKLKDIITYNAEYIKGYLLSFSLSKQKVNEIIRNLKEHSKRYEDPRQFYEYIKNSYKLGDLRKNEKDVPIELSDYSDYTVSMYGRHGINDLNYLRRYGLEDRDIRLLKKLKRNLWW